MHELLHDTLLMGGKQEVVCAVIGYGRRCVVGSEEHFAGLFLSNLQIC